MRSILWKLLALLCVLGLVAAACGNDDDDEVTTTDATPVSTTDDDADDSGEGTDDADDMDDADDTGDSDAGDEPCEATVPGTKITYAVFTPNASMDPTASSGSLVGGSQLVNVWDVIMQFNPETGEYFGRVAESLIPNDDFTEWTLTIRPGITYGNGDAFTVADILPSLQRFLDGRGNGVGNLAEGSVRFIDFETTEIVDDQTIIFRLNQPWATFPLLLADEGGMITNPRVVDALVAENEPNATEEDSAFKLARNALGTSPDSLNAASFGPYEVVEVEPRVRTVLRARDDYWGGPVCIEEIEFIFPGSTRANWDSFQAGDVNAAFLREPKVLNEAREAGEQLSTELQNVGGVFLINNGVRGAEVPGTDPRIRQAISMAIDRDIINERAFEGLGFMGNELAQEGTLLWSQELQDCADQLTLDPDRAAELVQEVKDETGWDGSLFFVFTDQVPGPDIALAVEGMLERVGFDVTVDLGPTTFLIDRVIISADYELAGWGHNMDGGTWVSALNQNYRSDSSSNRTAFGHPDMDNALNNLFSAATVEEQRAALAAVQCLWSEHIPTIIYSANEEGLVLAPNIQGVQRTVSTLFLFADAYIN